MSVIAQAPPARRKQRSQKASQKASTRTRAPFAGGVVWIVVIGGFLAGIVALNVVVLQLNMRLDDLGRERARLKADSALLRSQLSSASSNVRIEQAARTRLGLVPADPISTTYVRLAAK